MNRMPEKQTGSWTVSNCALSCFYQYSNHLFFRLRSNKLKYSGFFYDFSICFVSYYFCESWILSCELTLSEGKKIWGNVVFTRSRCVSISLHSPFNPYANSPSFSGFRWRHKCRLWFLRCLPFWAPCLLWRSRFFKLCFRIFIPKF